MRAAAELFCVAAVQIVLAIRVASRMAATARGARIARAGGPVPDGDVSVLVPVLNEERRLPECLKSLRAQGPVVREILVIDGGSTDATREVVAAAAAIDARVRLIDGAACPADWNGKAWNLERGLRASSDASRYVVTIDADVRASQGLVASLVRHASASGVAAFSVATRQRLADALSGLFHPSMLATLVYRFGIPGTATASLGRVQANGQCFFAVRQLLVETDAIARARDSRCDDVTIARAIAASGTPVGFYESDELASVTMYDTWRDLLANWPRSLPMLDRYSGPNGWIGLLDVAFVQAAPPWLAALVWIAGPSTPLERAVLDLQLVLIAMRVAVLFGTRRAYDEPPATYWLSPLADVPVAAMLFASAVRRRHTWRGRMLVAGGAR